MLRLLLVSRCDCKRDGDVSINLNKHFVVHPRLDNGTAWQSINLYGRTSLAGSRFYDQKLCMSALAWATILVKNID